MEAGKEYDEAKILSPTLSGKKFMNY